MDDDKPKVVILRFVSLQELLYHASDIVDAIKERMKKVGRMRYYISLN